MYRLRAMSNRKLAVYLERVHTTLFSLVKVHSLLPFVLLIDDVT